MTVQNFSALLLNLDRDVARRQHMEKQLAQAGIIYARQPGILGDAVPDDLRPYLYDASGACKSGMKRGEIGCYASHLRALTRVATHELGEVVLIMEDDLKIDADLAAIIADACRAAPAAWDIIRLSCPTRRAYAPVARVGARRLVRYSKIPNSAGAYLVTPAGAKKFLQKGVRGLTFDDDLRRPWFHHMETYGVLPPPVVAGALASTIDSVESGRFDKGISSRMERVKRGDHWHALRRVAYNMGNLGIMGWFACAAINCLDAVLKPVMGRGFIDKAARLFPLRR